MKPVKCAWFANGRNAVIFGVIVGFVAFLSPDYSNILPYFFGAVSAIITSMGIVFIVISVRIRSNYRRLKKIGVCYSAKIDKVSISLLGMVGLHRFTFRTIGHGHSIYAVCTYRNNDDKVHTVQSPLFLARGLKASGYGANVYVNPESPLDYAVEVLYEGM